MLRRGRRVALDDRSARRRRCTSRRRSPSEASAPSAASAGSRGRCSHCSGGHRVVASHHIDDYPMLDFEALALVRPAAPEKFVRHRNWGKRLVVFLLRQMHGLMPEAYHPPTSQEIAAVAARVLLTGSSGVSIVDADQVRTSGV